MKNFLPILFLFSPLQQLESQVIQKNHVPFSHLLRWHDPRVGVILHKILAMEECRELVKRATLQGAISISINDSARMPFQAMWDGGKRLIVVAMGQDSPPDIMLRNLLFELHNAASAAQVDTLAAQAQEGLIDCDHYVKQSEKIEHDNLLQTAALLEKGIARGIFSPASRWRVVEDFNIHYQIQQLSDHSLHLVREYEGINPRYSKSHPFNGTVHGLEHMSEEVKFDRARSLYLAFRQK